MGVDETKPTAIMMFAITEVILVKIVVKKENINHKTHRWAMAFATHTSFPV